MDRALSQAVVLRDPLCGHTRPHAVVVVCIPRQDGDDEVVAIRAASLPREAGQTTVHIQEVSR